MKRWKDDYYEYTQKDLYLVTREGSMFFENIPVDGSAELDDTYMESLEPFDMSKAVPFQEGYLSGYEALKYDVPKEKCRRRAEERMKKYIYRCYNSSINRGSIIALGRKFKGCLQ